MSRVIEHSIAVSTSEGVLIVKEMYDPIKGDRIFEYECYKNLTYNKVSKEELIEMLLTEEEMERAEYEHLGNKLADIRIMRHKLMYGDDK